MTTDELGRVMLCYDGSDAAANAIRKAAGLLSERRAVVASVYTIRITDLLPGVDVEERARSVAEEGAGIARGAGFEAEAVPLDTPAIWRGLVDYAERSRATVVVAGTTGTSAVGTILGSVAYGIAHHCKRPVLLVRPD